MRQVTGNARRATYALVLSLHRLLEDFERLHLDCVHDLLSSTTARVRNLLCGALRVLDDLLLPLVDVMICSKRIVLEYFPVGSCAQLSRFLLVKSFMSCQTCPPSLLQLGRGLSALAPPPRSSWTSSTNSWNCREVPVL